MVAETENPKLGCLSRKALMSVPFPTPLGPVTKISRPRVAAPAIVVLGEGAVGEKVDIEESDKLLVAFHYSTTLPPLELGFYRLFGSKCGI